MSDQRVEVITERRVTKTLPASGGDAAPEHAAGDETASPQEAKDDTRREATAARDETARHEPKGNSENGSRSNEVSRAKIRMQKRLPALDDDGDVGIQKEHIVTRDGKADLHFNGVLLASAAPASAPKGHWQEYRIYQTNGDKHVFSKAAKTVEEEEGDTHEAEVFDPAPSSVPSQLMRSAREIARSRPLTWMDAAATFFGYDPLAKALYRKVSGQFEEHIS